MSIEKWIMENTSSLAGKKIAVTGSTGGLGRELCRYLASLGADLFLIDRNQVASEQHAKCLTSSFPRISVTRICADLEDIDSVKRAIEILGQEGIDVFIHNAGAYSIPRHKCKTGFDNVFQINFASPYYMIRELLPILRQRCGGVVVVGSIAHNYSKIDVNDIDFGTCRAASLVYGNAKRYLMFALFELFKNEDGAALAITHPGITFTNITAHYPKVIFAIIKHPMKVIFMSPRRAALCILKGVFESCNYCEWIGPRIFDVWGLPCKKTLHTCGHDEIKSIAKISEDVYERQKSTL